MCVGGGGAGGFDFSHGNMPKGLKMQTCETTKLKMIEFGMICITIHLLLYNAICLDLFSFCFVVVKSDKMLKRFIC